MATGSSRLSATVVKKVTFSQPSTSRTSLTGSKETAAAETDRKKKRRQHQRHQRKMKSLSKPLLDGVQEAAVKTTKQDGGGAATGDQKGPPDSDSGLTATCPDYFGVRSYLHHFYENVAVKNPDLYEELEGQDYRYLIRPKKRRCKAFWWKLAVWTGINLLAVGVVVILVGYLVPRHPVVIGYQDDLEVIDKTALRYNYNLDACKLIGLIVFCVGGTVVAISLLFPSFLYNYCDEECTLYAEPFKVNTSMDDDQSEEIPKSPTDKKIPVDEELTRVQPVWVAQQAAEDKNQPIPIEP